MLFKGQVNQKIEIFSFVALPSPNTKKNHPKWDLGKEINKSLKTTWVKKYLDTTNHGKWKFLFDLELENYGRHLIFRGNLNVSDTKKEVRATDPFLKEILEYWAEINFVDQVSSDIAFQEQFLWFNSLIRIDNKPIFFKEWFEIGISKVKHLNQETIIFWLSKILPPNMI